MDYRQRRETGTGWNARRTAGLGLILAVVVFFLPLLTMGGEPVLGLAQQGEGGGAAQGESVQTQAAKDRGKVIKLLQTDGMVTEMTLEDYLFGVVAAEMPAYFEPEALKAQAVAARTYAMYCAETCRHSEAQVCTDYSCCQAWISREDMESNWGDSFEANYAAVSRAVEETEGEYLVYEGQPVFAAFHSSSCGATEDCGAIWNPLPYLVSVSSPETADTVPGYVSQVELSSLDFRDTVLSAYPWADFTGEESSWVGEISLEDSGRVASALLGGVEISGTEIRSLFSLRSTAFTLEYTGSGFLFTVTGYGHGVGMSQHGANLMAAQGSDYTRILAHYYPGTTLVK